MNNFGIKNHSTIENFAVSDAKLQEMLHNNETSVLDQSNEQFSRETIANKIL